MSFIIEADGTVTLPVDERRSFDPQTGTGSSLFTPTVAADDGCIDTLKDEFGFVNYA